MSVGSLTVIAAVVGLIGGLVRWFVLLYLHSDGSPVEWRGITNALWAAMLGAGGGIIALVLLLTVIGDFEGTNPAAVALLAFVAGLWIQSLVPELARLSERIFDSNLRLRTAMPLDDIEREIRAHIDHNSLRFRAAVDFPLWVVKYLSPRWLAGFMASGQLGISRTPGFTWGDGVYVAPLDRAYSSAMYGRACILGFIERADLQRVYDAADPKGLDLYQRWIRTQVTLYRQLTTTIHADVANRELRNIFRTRFGIDLVIFEPDELPAGYSSPLDRWFCVTDWTASPPGQSFAPTARIRECRFVAILGEEFSQEKYRVDWPRYFAPAVGAAAPITWDDVAYPTALPTSCKRAHAANAPSSPSAPSPHPVNRLVHVRPVS